TIGAWAEIAGQSATLWFPRVPFRTSPRCMSGFEQARDFRRTPRKQREIANLRDPFNLARRLLFSHCRRSVANVAAVNDGEALAYWASTTGSLVWRSVE